jgi:hypothetical protein
MEMAQKGLTLKCPVTEVDVHERSQIGKRRLICNTHNPYRRRKVMDRGAPGVIQALS